MSFQFSENLTAVAFAQYKKKLEVIGPDSCPYKYPADSRINNPSSGLKLNIQMFTLI